MQNELEELLFAAYFSEGKNTADHAVLTELAVKAGCPENEVRSVLSSSKYAEDVERDVEEAYQIGVRGVPFFVFDRKYAISGAQDVSVFLETMKAVDQ